MTFKSSFSFCSCSFVFSSTATSTTAFLGLRHNAATSQPYYTIWRSCPYNLSRLRWHHHDSELLWYTLVQGQACWIWELKYTSQRTFDRVDFSGVGMSKGFTSSCSVFKEWVISATYSIFSACCLSTDKLLMFTVFSFASKDLIAALLSRVSSRSLFFCSSRNFVIWDFSSWKWADIASCSCSVNATTNILCALEQELCSFLHNPWYSLPILHAKKITIPKILSLRGKTL